MRKVLQHRGVRLVVLTACQSAVSAPDDALSSVAAQLLQGEGADAVVAMSASLLTVSAARYAETFYRTLVASMSVQIAHERARHALYSNMRRHPYRRHRNEERLPVELSDWWLPHFYQYRPVILQMLSTRQSRSKPQETLSSHCFNEQMPAEPCYGFTGRAHELLQIERMLMRGKLVVISGFGGSGKTALVREAADWLTRTKMFDGACFVPFEQGGDSAMLLSVLGPRDAQRGCIAEQ
jgi:hypothetical protein